ncbi:MAG: LemA family protein [DPANN group archaeon]|nr:LemA family protein [DPANN group archaeon]
MSVGMIVLLVVVVLLLFSGIWLVAAYNGLVSLDENVNGKWAQVETVYQRRADLIPNLVETVKGAKDFEQSVLLGVTEARTKWLNAKSPGDQVAAANQMDGALSRLLVTVEAYPDIKSNQNFIALQDELANTENKIAVERKRYNDAVQIFNAKIRRFPTSIVAGMFGFDQRIYYRSDEGTEKAPGVKF